MTDPRIAELRRDFDRLGFIPIEKMRALLDIAEAAIAFVCPECNNEEPHCDMCDRCSCTELRAAIKRLTEGQ